MPSLAIASIAALGAIAENRIGGFRSLTVLSDARPLVDWSPHFID